MCNNATASRSAWQAKKTVRLLSGIGIGAIATLVVAIFGLGYQIVSLIQDAGKNVADAAKTIADYREHQNAIDTKVRHVEKQLKHLRGRRGLPQTPDIPAAPRESDPSKEGEKVQ